MSHHFYRILLVHKVSVSSDLRADCMHGELLLRGCPLSGKKKVYLLCWGEGDLKKCPLLYTEFCPYMGGGGGGPLPEAQLHVYII